MSKAAQEIRRFIFAIAVSIALPALAHAVQIHGVVKNAVTLEPVGGAQLDLVILGFSPIPTVAFAVSAADGSYTMDVANAGNTVFTYADGYADGFFDFKPVHDVQNFLLTPVAAITGTLYDPSSQPIDFSYVSLLDATTGATVSGSQTYNGGKFAFNDIPPGTYMVCLFAPNDDYRDACFDHWNAGADGIPHGTPVTVASGQLIRNVDIHFETGASISGTLADRATLASLGSADVSLYTPQGALVTDYTTYPDAIGAYRIGGVAPGDYYLVIGSSFSYGSGYYPHVYGGSDCDPTDLAPPYYLPACSFTGVTPLTVPNAGLSGIDFALSSGGTISGRVTDAATGLGIQNVQVYACSPPLYNLTSENTTDANGHYRLTHVLSSFLLRTVAPYGYMDMVWPNTFVEYGVGCVSDDPASHLTLPTLTSEIDGLDFSLSTGTHASGTVFGADGVPVRVAFLMQNGTNWGVAEIITSDAQGFFAINDLAPGEYTAVAYLNDGTACAVFGDSPCGADWQPSDPLSADLTNIHYLPLGFGTVITTADIHLYSDRVFRSGFE